VPVVSGGPGSVSFLSGSDVDLNWLMAQPLEEREDDGTAAIRAFHKRRTENSGKKRRKAQQKHWSNKWLERAHLENPKFGPDRLLQRARQMFAAWQDERAKLLGKKRRNLERERKKREEITEHRARVYLQAIRKNTGDV
jgi:hypothetical protein